MDKKIMESYTRTLSPYISLCPADYVYLEAYDYCKNNNLVPYYCNLSDKSLARQLNEERSGSIPMAGHVLFNVHMEPDRDGPRDVAIEVRPWALDYEILTSNILSEYYQHRYTTFDTERPVLSRREDQEDSWFELGSYNSSEKQDLQRLPKTGCALLEYLHTGDRNIYEWLYTFHKRDFVFLFGYNGEMLFVWNEKDKEWGPSLGMADASVFSEVHKDWFSEWCSNPSRYVLDDEYVRFNILHRRYIVRRYIPSVNGRVTFL